jgi:hypothetical protein
MKGASNLWLLYETSHNCGFEQHESIEILDNID